MQFGIIVDSLNQSQLSTQLISSINNLYKLDRYVDVIVFFKQYDIPIIHPYFPVMNINELYGFRNPVISTCISTTKILQKQPFIEKKFFYVWSLEWMFFDFNYSSLDSVYMDKDIELIARSEIDAQFISACWRKPSYIIEEFNYEKTYEVITGTSKKI